MEREFTQRTSVQRWWTARIWRNLNRVENVSTWSKDRKMRNRAQYAIRDTQYAIRNVQKLIQTKLRCEAPYFKEGASKIRTILLVWLHNDLWWNMSPPVHACALRSLFEVAQKSESAFRNMHCFPLFLGRNIPATHTYWRIIHIYIYLSLLGSRRIMEIPMCTKYILNTHALLSALFR